MDKYQYYCLPDDGIIARIKIGGVQFERYDADSGDWIPDWNLSGIYSDDMRSIYCKTEEEAWKVLNLHSQ